MVGVRGGMGAEEAVWFGRWLGWKVTGWTQSRREEGKVRNMDRILGRVEPAEMFSLLKGGVYDLVRVFEKRGVGRPVCEGV